MCLDYVSKKSYIIYVQLKRCITKSTCLTEQTLEKTITNTKLKYDIALGSHKNQVLTLELENLNCSYNAEIFYKDLKLLLICIVPIHIKYYF